MGRADKVPKEKHFECNTSYIPRKSENWIEKSFQTWGERKYGMIVECEETVHFSMTLRIFPFR